MDRREYRTASDIYKAIVGNQTLKSYTVVITGKSGPTGKTTLCSLLNNAGVKVVDISNDLNQCVKYANGYGNEMLINYDNETVLVVLNRFRFSGEE